MSGAGITRSHGGMGEMKYFYWSRELILDGRLNVD